MLAIIGIISIIVPLLGVPIFFKEVVSIVLGIILCVSAFRGYRLYQKTLKKEQLGEAHSNATPKRIN